MHSYIVAMLSEPEYPNAIVNIILPLQNYVNNRS